MSNAPTRQWLLVVATTILMVLIVYLQRSEQVAKDADDAAFIVECTRLGGIVYGEFHNPENGLCVILAGANPVVILEQTEWLK